MSTGDEQQSAGGVVPRQRWRRGLAAAVAVTGASVLAVTIAWQGQSHDPRRHAADPAQSPTDGVTGLVQMQDGLNGGRIAPALLGGLVGPWQTSVATTPDEENAPLDEETTPSPSPTGSPSARPTDGSPTAPATVPPSDGDVPDHPVHGPVTINVGSVEASADTPGRFTVVLRLTNVTPGMIAKVAIDGDGAVIDGVGGGWSCGSPGGAAVTCNVGPGDSTRLVVTVSAPYGGTLAVSLPHLAGGAASTSVEIDAPGGGTGDEGVGIGTPAGTAGDDLP
ncbi:hypothetical protein [Nocardioides alcanivorans]|uniref:hypothetical protein n=1 Tax=Nocardioides alcanivorans TaxID=2897352 RepID=UPI001F16EA26|nr:hypothetical protein [Nocardioides alcanivorans]